MDSNQTSRNKKIFLKKGMKLFILLFLFLFALYINGNQLTYDIHGHQWDNSYNLVDSDWKIHADGEVLIFNKEMITKLNRLLKYSQEIVDNYIENREENVHRTQCNSHTRAWMEDLMYRYPPLNVEYDKNSYSQEKIDEHTKRKKKKKEQEEQPEHNTDNHIEDNTRVKYKCNEIDDGRNTGRCKFSAGDVLYDFRVWASIFCDSFKAIKCELSYTT